MGVEKQYHYRDVFSEWLDLTYILWKPLITRTNSNITSKSLSRILSKNRKRTRQEVPNILLSYLYYKYMVHASNK